MRQEEIPSLPFLFEERECPSVSQAREILVKRIRERLAVVGKTPRAVSLEIGANASYIGQVLNGKGGMPAGDKLRRIAESLGTTTNFLLGQVDTPVQPLSEVDILPIDQNWRDRTLDRIKVFGTGYCDDLVIQDDGHLVEIEQTCLEPTNVVALIERPTSLAHAKDVYAIYFHGSSMEPRFFQGEVAVVVPSPPPGPGDFVVVQLNDGTADDVIHVLVKRLVRSTSSYIELEQYNPRTLFKIDRKRVTRLHRILTPNQLLAR